MGDRNGGTILGDSVQGLLDNDLASNVYSTCRLVKNEDGRLFDYASCDGKPLTLSATELNSIIANQCLIALLEIS